MPSAQQQVVLRKARSLRKRMTDGEKRLWGELKQWRIWYGLHWRRQAPLGPYVADFLCHQRRIVLEVDGEFHATAAGRQRDVIRDTWVSQQGYRTIRLNTGDLSDNFDGCIESLLRDVGVAR